MLSYPLPCFLSFSLPYPSPVPSPTLYVFTCSRVPSFPAFPSAFVNMRLCTHARAYFSGASHTAKSTQVNMLVTSNLRVQPTEALRKKRCILISFETDAHPTSEDRRNMFEYGWQKRKGIQKLIYTYLRILGHHQSMCIICRWRGNPNTSVATRSKHLKSADSSLLSPITHQQLRR